MLKQSVKEFYGTYSKAADLLGLSRSAISNWDDLIPEASALKLHFLTDGQLKYDPALYAKNTADSVDISCPQVTSAADA